MRRPCLPALLCCAALALSGCRKSATAAPSTKVQSTFNIQSLQMANLVSVDWTLDFYFLDANPPSDYNPSQQFTSTKASGQILAVLPCLTNPSGTGNNQVKASAILHFSDGTQATGTGSAVFTCTQSVDTPINLMISIQMAVNAGFVDPNGQVTVVNCDSSYEWKDDSWLAVCSDSSCGDAESVLLLEDNCSQLGTGTPTFWTCGAPADWTILDLNTSTPPVASATCQFPVPASDGSWTFGAAALPQVTFAVPDPTLTDAAGNLVVYSNVSTPVATLIRSGGVNTVTPVDANAAYAVDLVLAADTPGGPTPHQLLQIRTNTTGSNPGTSATVWEPFGACDSPVLGTQSWSGLYPIDVRLVDPATAKLMFATTPDGLASQSALCTAVWANDGTPQLSCAAAGSL